MYSVHIKGIIIYLTLSGCIIILKVRNTNFKTGNTKKGIAAVLLIISVYTIPGLFAVIVILVIPLASNLLCNSTT